MNNLYDTLGVPPDADSKEIKRAYKAKAQRSHPDRGGDPEEFHQVSLAYQVLSDPDRRDRYDNTGDTEDRGSPKDEAEKSLADLFDRIIDSEHRGDLIKKAEKTIRHTLDSLRRKQESAKATLSRLEKLAGRVKASGKTNLFQSVVDQKKESAKADLRSHQHNISVAEAALALLREYQDCQPEEPPEARFDINQMQDILRYGSGMFGTHRP